MKRFSGGVLRNGRYDLRKATMLDLIATAWSVDPDTVLGCPSWLGWDRFDIAARAPADTSSDTLKLMLRSLLAQRYLLTIREQVLPKREAGQAVACALKKWTALTRHCSDGDLLIDNNGTERSLRSFAAGRNNWSFFGSDNGGKTAAVLRSFVTSCELARIDPFAWFHDVLGRIAKYPVKRVEELLPHRWTPVAR